MPVRPLDIPYRDAQAEALGSNVCLAGWRLMSLTAIQPEQSTQACERCRLWNVKSQLHPRACGAFFPLKAICPRTS